jgi:UDP-N-acetylmuramoyl-L-alanyl-D-glutamate--2,6-diaminopimelate ligase
MEVSSIALREHRVDGITFDVVAFTGLTQDHLDYHGTMEAYFEAKADLFMPGRARRGVVMVDDSWGRALAENSSIPVTTVSSSDRAADWFASRSGDRVTIVGPEEAHVRLPVPTDFAVLNLAVSIAVCHLLGVSSQVAADAAVRARIPGRMEVVSTVDGINFVVDYAHTPDAIHQVVSSAASLRESGGGRVIVVVGAGGDRDPSKRAAMGSAAARAADVLFVTDDNPRSEDPAAIRASVLAGTSKAECRVYEVADRAEAIQRAVDEAVPSDIVLVLGKGHERTQEVGGHVLPFDDRHVLASFVRDRFGGGVEGDER